MKLSFGITKFQVKRWIAVRKNRLRKKISKLEQKALASKRKAAYAAKDIFITTRFQGQSPVPQLLHSNVPPTEVVEALVRAAIADAEVKSAEEAQNRASEPISSYSAAATCALASQTPDLLWELAQVYRAWRA